MPAPGDRGFGRGVHGLVLKRAFHLTLRDPQIAVKRFLTAPKPTRARHAVLEALLQRAARAADDDISHLNGLGYARDTDEALALLEAATYDVGFFMAPTPVERIRAVAAAGESMPPKSTYFYPKVPTGLLFNPLDG